MTVMESRPEVNAGALHAPFAGFCEALDLTPIKFKLVKEKNWTLERANAVEPQYKAFLFMIGWQDQPLVPSVDIDEMWHAHILDTRKYMADCAKLFGEYLHHYPYLGMRDEADRARLDALYEATCEHLYAALGVNPKIISFSECGGGGCGGGGSGCSGGSACSVAGGSDTPSAPDAPSKPSAGDVWSYIPFISSCSTTTQTPDRSRRRDRPGRPAQKKRGILRRILGLTPQQADRAWQGSVTPALFPQKEYRPDAAALESLTKTDTRH